MASQRILNSFSMASCLLQVPEIHADMQSHTGSSQQTPEAMAARARTLERSGQWSGAIDAYLAITTQDTADLDFLEAVSASR